MRHQLLLASCCLYSTNTLQSPAQTLHDLKWTPVSMRYYATRPRKDAPARNETFVSCVRHFLVNRRRAILYVAYFALGVAPAKAVHHDKWTALRQSPVKSSGIRMRRRRAQAISQFAGIGYSPRVVALAGLMLRSLAKCFRMPMEPSIGFGVGAKFAAQYAHREWLPCLVLGWFAGGWYWDALDVKPPAWATGVPIVINRVRPGFGLRGAHRAERMGGRRGARVQGEAAPGFAGAAARRARGGAAAADPVLRHAPHRRRVRSRAPGGPGVRELCGTRHRTDAVTETTSI